MLYITEYLREIYIMNNFFKIVILSSICTNFVACAVFTEVSSSTSSTADAVTPDITLNEFVQKRYVAIRHDAANGGGENLDALAQLLGKKDKTKFAGLMKENFDRIFNDIEEPSQIITRIELQAGMNKSKG